jgi:4-amino-4-deoxy-L-arabinose transferase-like glycosyltransferase
MSAEASSLRRRTWETGTQEFEAIRARAKRIPTLGWMCALTGFLCAATWSLIVPVFQVPDEQDHVAYAQYLAETGKPPPGTAGRPRYSDEEQEVLRALGWRQTTHRPENRPLATEAAHRRLEKAVDRSADRTGAGGPTHATGQPPLYYAAEAVAYRLSPSTSLPDRVHLMRLLSALMAAGTVLFIFLFLMEVLPGRPWAWTVGALAVAFQPMFGFISGGVNNDNLMNLAAAAVFLGLAISFRDRLTPGRGVWIGAWAAVGVLAKITMLGLLPGVALGVALLVKTADRAGRPPARGGALASVVVLALPLLLYMLLNTTVWDRGAVTASPAEAPIEYPDPVAPESTGAPQTANVPGALSYVWQFYLPRIPSMTPAFQGYQANDVWFRGFVGRFGWLDYDLPSIAYTIAALIGLIILVLAAMELRACWPAVRARLAEIATYVAILVSLVLFVNVAGYFGRLDHPGFEQARYLFPLLALYAALIAVAARGAGRRWGPAAGILLVSAAVAHSAVAILLTLTRYYG